MGNGARVHNHFCVMPKVDPRYGSRHPANPAGKCYYYHSQLPTGTLSPVLSIHAYCASYRSVVYLTKSLKTFKGSFLSVVLSFRLYLVALCTFYKERL